MGFESKEIDSTNTMTTVECLIILGTLALAFAGEQGTGKTAFDAINYAINYIESHPDKKRFFYTYGSDREYPYGAGEYVEVHAKDAQTANKIYSDQYPNRPGNILNCAFVYTEDQWIGEGIRDKYYKDKLPAVVMEEN